jgi:hypothetical protein
MATPNELRICDPCWDSRDSPVDRHGCPARIVEATNCDCPCRDRHADLMTIDLSHDLGLRDLTDPFGEEE